MPLWQRLLLVFDFCSAWHIIGVLGIKFMNCPMIVRTIAKIILNDFFFRNMKDFAKFIVLHLYSILDRKLVEF